MPPERVEDSPHKTKASERRREIEIVSRPRPADRKPELVELRDRARKVVRAARNGHVFVRPRRGRRKFRRGFRVRDQRRAQRCIVREPVREHDGIDVQQDREQQAEAEKRVLHVAFVDAARAVHRVVEPDLDRRLELRGIIRRFIEQEAERDAHSVGQEIDARLEMFALRDAAGAAADEVQKSERERARRNVGGAIRAGESADQRMLVNQFREILAVCLGQEGGGAPARGCVRDT